MDKVLRIGSLSDRTGVSPELLRAWERRYGLLRPARTRGGFRLYGEDDAERVRAMQRLMSAGLSPAQAAREVLGAGDAGLPGPSPSGPPLERELERFSRALVSLDEATLQSALDDLLARFEVETVIGGVLLPALRELGEGWERGDVSVAQEHFGVNVVRGRLVALARGWDRGLGPRAVLACPPGELHDVSLVMFGLALRRGGWRVTFLGANTPLESIADVARPVAPDLCVLYSPDWSRQGDLEAGLRALASTMPLALAAESAAGLAAATGARLLTTDPVSAAQALTAEGVR